MQTILPRRCRICHRRYRYKTCGPRKSRATVDPENPDPNIPVLPPVEVTKGLSLDFASSLSFGQQKLVQQMKFTMHMDRRFLTEAVQSVVLFQTTLK